MCPHQPVGVGVETRWEWMLCTDVPAMLDLPGGSVREVGNAAARGVGAYAIHGTIQK